MSTRLPVTEHLIADAQNGSRDALGGVLEGCRDYLLHVAARELAPGVRSKLGASDLVQDTLFEAQRDFARFRGGSEAELLGWLRQILRNNLANAARRYLATTKRSADREVRLGDRADDGANAVAAADASPSAAAATGEERAALLAALARLPDDQRRAIVLRSFDGLPFDAVAAHLGRTADAARRLWARAVCRLQSELKVTP